MSSLSRTLYTGVTGDIERRVSEHKQHQPGSFTARYNVNRLVNFEEYDYAYDAIAREEQIKKMTRRRKIFLIESTNPDWEDLYEEWHTDPKDVRDSSRAPDTRAGMTGKGAGK